MKVNCSLYHLLLFWKRFLYQEVKQIILKNLRDFCLILWHQDHFQNNNKNTGKNSPSHKNKRHLLKNSSKTWKKRSSQTFTTYLTSVNLVYPILATLRLISALYFTFTENKILLLDPPPNENPGVSFAPHKTTENTTTFLVFMKTQIKWEEILKIDRLKCSKSFISIEKKLKSFLQK